MAAHNPGYLTASTIAPFLTGKGDSLLKGGETAAIEIAKERLSLDGYVQPEEPWQGNEATAWGHANENDALIRYEEHTFSTVTDKQKGVADGWLSCTPDGYVGSDGLVEVKSPFTTKVHMGYLLDSDSLRDQYNDQCQFQLMLTGRTSCDLVSYDPRWKEPLDIVVVRIEPDIEWQARTLERIRQAEIIIKQTIECLIKSK